MVKLKGEIIVNSPVCEVTMDNNWDNSMAQYYPVLWVTTMIDGKPVSKSFGLGEGEPSYLFKQVEFVLDADMVAEYKAYNERVKYELEFPIVRKGKIVEVIKGRKVPIGTQAKVFWVGQTKYGTSCGLELANGNKVFTSYHNLKVIAM